jgi:hypothetical protein
MVTEQGHIFRHFGIRLFGNPEDKRSGVLCAGNPRSHETRHIFGVGQRSYILAVQGFDISAIPGTRSQALDIESPEVVKRDIPSELGCGHGGCNRIDQNFDILAFRHSGDRGARGTRCQGSRNRETQNFLFRKKVAVVSGGRVQVKARAWCMFVQVGFSRKDLWIGFMGFQ